jgi:protein SCO1/2
MAVPEHHATWVLRGSGCFAALLLALGAASASASSPTKVEQVPGSQGRVVIAQPPKPIDDFELVDQEGQPFKFSQLRNRPALVFFGFTHCPDVCPATLAKLRLLADSAAPQVPDVEIVMISVDGDRDSPATMKAYLAQVSPRFIGLTGDPRIVRGIAGQFPAVFFKGLADRPGGAYAIAHTSQVYLIDRQGRLRATFYDATIEAMEKVTRNIAE